MVPLGSLCRVEGLPGRWVVEEYLPYSLDQPVTLPYIVRSLDPAAKGVTSPVWPDAPVKALDDRFHWARASSERMAIIARQTRMRKSPKATPAHEGVE